MRIVCNLNNARMAARIKQVVRPHRISYDVKNAQDKKCDFLLIPSSVWYKNKNAKKARKYNRAKGRVVLIDYAIEMERVRRNATFINADYIAMSGDYCPNEIKAFPFSNPWLDIMPIESYSPLERAYYDSLAGKDIAVVTSRDDDDHRQIRKVAEYVSEYDLVVWKIRGKWANVASIVEKHCGQNTKIISADDYNSAVPVLEIIGHHAKLHLNLGRMSFVNIEMIRYGVKSRVWKNGKATHPASFKKYEYAFDGKPSNWCTKNLMRHLHEVLNTH